MTFFYNLNKKLAEITDKPEQKQLNERGEKWIQKAVDPSHKGDLHKALHVPQGEKILGMQIKLRVVECEDDAVQSPIALVPQHPEACRDTKRLHTKGGLKAERERLRIHLEVRGRRVIDHLERLVGYRKADGLVEIREAYDNRTEPSEQQTWELLEQVGCPFVESLLDLLQWHRINGINGELV